MGVVVPVGERVATMIFNVDGSTKDMTWSFGFTGPVGEDVSATATIIRLAFTSYTGVLYVPYTAGQMEDVWTFVGVSVMEMTGAGPLVGQSYGNTVGSQTSQPLPVNCALLLNKQTALGGRKNRGRAYLPPVLPAESEVDQVGVLAGGAITHLNAMYGRAYDALYAEGVIPVLHHSDGSAGTPITGWTIGSTIATQRRRLR